MSTSDSVALALRVLLDAWRMITRDLHMTVRVVILPWLLMMGLGIGISYTVASQLTGGAERYDTLALIGLLSVIYFVAGHIWIIVAWHRYALRCETPKGPLPQVHGKRMLAYFGVAMLVFVLLFVPAAMVFMAIMGLVGPAIEQGAARPAPHFMAVLVVGNIALLVLGLRICLVFPAAALGEPMKITQSFGLTRGNTVALVLIVLITLAVPFLIGLVLLALPQTLIIQLAGVLVNCLYGLFMLSVITALYDTFAPGRA